MGTVSLVEKVYRELFPPVLLSTCSALFTVPHAEDTGEQPGSSVTPHPVESAVERQMAIAVQP